MLAAEALCKTSNTSLEFLGVKVLFTLRDILNAASLAVLLLVKYVIDPLCIMAA